MSNYCYICHEPTPNMDDICNHCRPKVDRPLPVTGRYSVVGLKELETKVDAILRMISQIHERQRRDGGWPKEKP